MDNREVSTILARLDRGEGMDDLHTTTAACAALLLDHCCRDTFSPGLPPFQILCRLAADPDRNNSAPAIQALYHGLIEPLCDDFTPTANFQAHTVLVGLLAFISATPQGHLIRDRLEQLRLSAPKEMLGRWQRLIAQADSPSPATLEKIESILIPSRISVGADVVITSVLVQRLAKALPKAEIVLVGPAHLAELFGTLPRVRHLPFTVERHGGLAERLLFWPRLLALVDHDLAGRPAGQVLVVDSDSRLTQLGLLPLASGAPTCQFPSQNLAPIPGHGSLSALANLWLDSWLGPDSPCFPIVAPPPEHRTASRTFCARLRQGGSKRLLLINLGVGGEARKSLPETFEQQLLSRLLALENTIIILDMGCGSEEKAKAGKLLGYLAGSGRPTAHLEEWQLSTATIPFRHGVVGICSSLGGLAALGGSVDCYLGYDSCGQHLANGAGTSAVTIFAGAPNPRFLERWSPQGPTGKSHIIPVTGNAPTPAESAALLAQIIGYVNQLPPSR